MKIVVLNGTEIKGCTYNMKEMFLRAMGEGNEIKEYYFPKDCPEFCKGCKSCFFKDISICPHREYTIPIWQSILWADLIVVTSPNYVFGPTAQIKAVLDHYGSKWMAHSPEKELFFKQAVIITNAIGAGMNNAIKVIRSSLNYWGVPKTYVIKQTLFDGYWKDVSAKRKNKIERKSQNVANIIKERLGKSNVGFKTKILFFAMKTSQKLIHKSEIKKGNSETKDHKHWADNGWLDGKKPWDN